jgi:hypothetical protein
MKKYLCFIGVIVIVIGFHCYPVLAENIFPGQLFAKSDKAKAKQEDRQEKKKLKAEKKQVKQEVGVEGEKIGVEKEKAKQEGEEATMEVKQDEAQPAETGEQMPNKPEKIQVTTE